MTYHDVGQATYFLFLDDVALRTHPDISTQFERRYVIYRIKFVMKTLTSLIHAPSSYVKDGFEVELNPSLQ